MLHENEKDASDIFPPKRPIEEVFENLKANQKQLDPDGCMVGVSREALDAVLEYLGLRLEAENNRILEHAEEEEGAATVALYTFTGKHLDLLSLKEEDIDINDIAHSLAMQCRYNGHTTKFYSVAEHCVLLAQYVLDHPIHGRATYTKQLAAVMLMHDASETYIGDMVYHLKKSLYAFEVLEEFILEKVRLKFKSPDPLGNLVPLQTPYLILEQLVKAIDRSASVDEMTQLHPGGVDPELYEMGCEALGITCQNWSPEQAKERFLWMAEQLQIQ